MKQELAKNLEQFGPFDEQTMQRIYQIFQRKESLYSQFRLAISTQDQVDEESFCMLLYDQFAQSAIISEFKGLQLLKAWIMYQIKLQTELNVEVSKMLEFIDKIFNQKKMSVQACIEHIAKVVYTNYKQIKAWKDAHRLKIEKLSSKISNHKLFKNQIDKSNRNEKHLQEQRKEKQINEPAPEKVYPEENGDNKFSLLQREKQGKLFLCEFEELSDFKDMLQLEIQKHIIVCFFNIVRLNNNHEPEFYQLFERHMPIQLRSLENIFEQMKNEKRVNPIIKKNLETIYDINNRINKLEKTASKTIELKKQYQQCFRLWSSIKEDLNVLNIFFLNHIIQSTEKQTQRIKDKDILFFIGPSGAGKTTIILRLLGYQLKETKRNDLFTLTPKNPLKPEHQQLITSPQAKSTTKYVLSSKVDSDFIEEKEVQDSQGKMIKVKPTIYLCDSPGFFQTSGIIVDIANGVGMINAIKHAKTVKPIIVISSNTISQKFQGIKELGKIVSDLFVQYRRQQEGNTTQFIFNKFSDTKEFNRLQPGILDILKNLSPNQESDGKYVRFLQVLYARLKKNKQILKFDPFQIDIKKFIDKLSQNPIEKPSSTFKYSFSFKSVLALKNYVNNKINIINNLLNSNINHAFYHIKQFKLLLELIPSRDFQEEYQNLVKRICSTTKAYFIRFKSILNEDNVKNEINNGQIQQMKSIYDKLKEYRRFNQISDIENYQEKDLLNLINNASQQLICNLKSYKFTYKQHQSIERTIRIIKSFSQNFDKNLLIDAKRYLKGKLESIKAEVEKVISSNSFKDYNSVSESYQTVCACYQIVDSQAMKAKSFQDLIYERYQKYKEKALIILAQIKQNNFQEQKDLSKFQKIIIDLDSYYFCLEGFYSIHLCPKIKEDNLKDQILKTLQSLVESYYSESQQILYSKEVQPLNVEKIMKFLSCIETVSNFRKLNQTCINRKKSIISMIKRLLEIELASLQKITNYMIKSNEFSSKIANLDLTLFRLRTYGRFVDLGQRNVFSDIQGEFFSEFLKSIQCIIYKIKTFKISIRSIFKSDQVNLLIKRINELKLLKRIQSSFKHDNQMTIFKQRLKQFENQCVNKLNGPFLQLNQDFSQLLSQDVFLKNSKKNLHELSYFIEYNKSIKQTMNSKDLELMLDGELQQQCHVKIKTFIKKFDDLLLKDLQIFNQNQGKASNLSKEVNFSFKKKLDLLSFMLNNDNIKEHLTGISMHQKFCNFYEEFIRLLEKDQEQLKRQYYKFKSQKDFFERLNSIRIKCYEMKQFDRYLGEEQSTFSYVLNMINTQYGKNQTNLTNKLLYIFTEQNVNFELLQQFYISNSSNPEIVQQIIQKLKEYDRKYYKQIEALKVFVDDLLFQDDNINYVKQILKAYNYLKGANSIVEKSLSNNQFILSLKYFKESMCIFTNKYFYFFQKIMQSIQNFQYKAGIPHKTRTFFENLEQLISKLLPEDYEQIKRLIAKFQFNQELKIEWPRLGISITSYILRINQTFKQQIQNNFTKVIDIFSPSSCKFYKILSPQQQSWYQSRLRAQFDKKMQAYIHQVKKEGVNEEDDRQLYEFLKCVPETTLRSCFEAEIKQTKIKAKEDREQQKQSLKSELNGDNLSRMKSIFNKMCSKDKQTYYRDLKNIITEIFKDIYLIHITPEVKIKKYIQSCLRFEESGFLQFKDVFQDSKKRAQEQIQKDIASWIQSSIAQVERDMDNSSYNSLEKKNKSIINFYLVAVSEKQNNQFLQRIAFMIKKYFASLVQLFQNQECLENKLISPIYKNKVQLLDKYVAQSYYISNLLKQLIDEQQQILNTIKQDTRIQQEIQIMKFFKKRPNLKQSLEKIASKIDQEIKQIQNFSFKEILNQLLIETHPQKRTKEYVSIIIDKINFFHRFQDVSSRYNFNEIQSMKKFNKFNCIQHIYRTLSRQLQLAKQEIKRLENKSIETISFISSVLIQFCFVWRQKMIDHQKQSNIPKIASELTKFIDDRLTELSEYSNPYSQLISTPGRPKGIFVTSKQILPDTNNEAKKAVEALIILQKMFQKIWGYQEPIKKAMKKLIQDLVSSKKLMNYAIIQMRNQFQIPQIRIICNRQKEFQPVLSSSFDQKTENQLQDYLQSLKKKNAHLKIDKDELTIEFQMYCHSFEQYTRRYIVQPSQETIKALSKETSDLKTKKQRKGILIGKIFGLYSILKSQQSKQFTFFFHPHLAQVIAVLLLLQESQQSGEVNCSVAEILTGQGKSIVLACIACVLALKGYKVYQVCYSQYLVKRDYQAFKNLFHRLEIEQSIHYNTFPQMYRNSLNKSSNQESLEKFIKNELNKSSNLFSKLVQGVRGVFRYFQNIFSMSEKQKKIMLIDQIDMLFSQEFEGQMYFPQICQSDHDGQEITNLIIFMVKAANRKMPLTLKRVKESKEFTQIIQKYSTIKDIILVQILHIIDKINETQSIKALQQQLIKEKVNIQSDYYERKDVYKYMVVLARLYEQNQLSLKQLKNRMKLYLKIGEFSYSQLPKYFGKIIGVSGTLSCLAPRKKQILLSEYQIKNIICFPSVYKKQVCKQSIQVLKCEKQAQLFTSLQNEIEKYFKCQDTCKRAMLIFFKDKKIIQRFKQSLISLQKLHINICYLIEEPKNLKQYDKIRDKILTVCSSNMLTLATKQFTRGVDYKDYELSQGLYVIQTYLPENEEDFFQTKGRTARAGKPGQYKLMINIQDAEDCRKYYKNYNFNLEDLRKFWKTKSDIELKKRAEKRGSAKERHKQTLREYEDNNIKSYIEKINSYQKKKQYLIVFGIQGSLREFKKILNWIINTIEVSATQIQKKNKIISLKFQICVYGNYENLYQAQRSAGFKNLRDESNFEEMDDGLIFRCSRISSNPIQFRNFMSSLKNFPFSAKGESVELFLRHVKRMRSSVQISSVFLFSRAPNMSWSSHTKTHSYLRQSAIAKGNILFKFYEVNGTYQSYLEKIKNLNIQMNLIAFDRGGYQFIIEKEIFCKYFTNKHKLEMDGQFKNQNNQKNQATISTFYNSRIEEIISDFIKA